MVLKSSLLWVSWVHLSNWVLICRQKTKVYKFEGEEYVAAIGTHTYNLPACLITGILIERFSLTALH